MSFRTAMQSFGAALATARRATWPVSVTPSGAASAIDAAKSPTKVSRIPNEQGTGYVQRAVAVFLFADAPAFTPAIGGQWTISASADAPDEVGTKWSCFELTLGGNGVEHRSVCFRLD